MRPVEDLEIAEPPASTLSSLPSRSLVLAAVGGALAVGGMWLPWFYSGNAARNSFSAFRAVQILGIDWTSPLRVVWFLLPVMFLAIVTALANRRETLAGCLLVLLGGGLAFGGGSFTVAVGWAVGSGVTMIAGLLTAGSAVLALTGERR